MSRWVDQTTFFDPDNPGSGNCTEAAVASLLGLKLEEVPNFRSDGFEAHKFWRAFKRFFRSRGYFIWMQAPDISIPVLHLASGPSSRGCSHMVIMRDGSMVHDPHPSRAGILSVNHTWVAIPIDAGLGHAP